MFMKFIHYFPQFVSNDVCLVKRTDSVRLTAPMVMKESIWTPRAVIAKIIIGSQGVRLYGLVMGSCIVEIDRTVIREVQYQFEVNRCRN